MLELAALALDVDLLLETVHIGRSVRIVRDSIAAYVARLRQADDE